MNQRSLTQPALADLADIPARSRWAHHGGLRLHALDYGGDGVPVLILPGITSPAVTMDFVARALTGPVRPVVLDVRGRGLSDDGDSYALDDYAADAEAVVEQLGLDHPLLLGHSMGARIATVVAVRARVPLRGTVIVDPPMSGPGRGPYPTPLTAFANQLQEARRGTDADEVARSWPSWPRREQELRARWLSSCGDVAITATHEGFESEDFFDWWPRIGANTPTTLMYGADSPVVTAEGAAEAASSLPAARLIRVPDAGHMVFWDNPDTSLALLRDALAAPHPAEERASVGKLAYD